MFYKLSDSLYNISYKKSKAYSSLFTKANGSSFTTILCYVDDMIITGNNLHEIWLVKDHLYKQFSIEDLGVLKYILGIEVAKTKTSLHLCQRKYALDLLNIVEYF